jgi:hypothetical protein
MTGRHAAPPDEAFDQRERERAGAHRADVGDPQGVIGDGSLPADADLQVEPAPDPAAPAKATPARKRGTVRKAATKPAPSKKAGT